MIQGRRRFLILGATALAAGLVCAVPVAASESSTYPDLGQAPDFTLTNELGNAVSRSQFNGKVTVVNFMFTRCGDICPTLTSKLADIVDTLAVDHANDVQFLSISVDPEYDRPEILADYAANFDYRSESWSFLTGDLTDVKKVARDYGVYMAASTSETVRHNLITSVIDREGVIRIQYMGERFDIDDLLMDIRNIAK